MSIYLLYIGQGKGTLIGVPAKDMTEEEARQFDVSALVKSGLYELANKPKTIVEKYNFDDRPKRSRRKISQDDIEE